MRSGGSRMVVRGGKARLLAGVLAAGLAAVGCGDDVARKVPDVRLARGPVQPAPVQNGPLPDTPEASNTPRSCSRRLPPGIWSTPACW